MEILKEEFTSPLPAKRPFPTWIIPTQPLRQGFFFVVVHLCKPSLLCILAQIKHGGTLENKSTWRMKEKMSNYLIKVNHDVIIEFTLMPAICGKEWAWHRQNVKVELCWDLGSLSALRFQESQHHSTFPEGEVKSAAPLFDGGCPGRTENIRGAGISIIWGPTIPAMCNGEGTWTPGLWVREEAWESRQRWMEQARVFF